MICALGLSCASLCALHTLGQFPPPADQPGTTAMHADSSAFVAWATACMVTRGAMNIADPDAGAASYGEDTWATGSPDEPQVVSLGDGGTAVLTFAAPIHNGPGWDLAVFENGLNDTFLELAFVEVSSNGTDYVRFPATSHTQTDTQVDAFGTLDATNLDNFAGKYRAAFGTPFNLDDVANDPLVDVHSITHVKVIDVVGCIQDAYATHDQHGTVVNDPWNTSFASSGFDLDAIGVIHQMPTGFDLPASQIAHCDIFPNPADERSILRYDLRRSGPVTVMVHDATGSMRHTMALGTRPAGTQRLPLNLTPLPNGLYFITLTTTVGTVTRNFMVQHER